MTGFSFIAPQRTLMGRGCCDQVAGEIAALGRRVLLLRGTHARADRLASELTGLGCDVTTIRTQGEPTLTQLDMLLITARAATPQVVVGLGGGAVMDMAKALAALAPASSNPLDHLEIVGRGQPLTVPPLPFVAIPTTAGTGAEATKNAVIGVEAQSRKVSLRDLRMMATLAVVDPALTDNCPRSVTLASGLDAITQVIEPYLSCRANPVTDALCRDSIWAGMAALADLMQGENPVARDTMARTSHFSGLALANSGLGAVHGLAGVIGGVTGAAHGAICGRLLPPVLAANRAAMQRAGLDTSRFDDVDRWIGAALGQCGLAEEMLERFADSHGLPRLAALGVTPDIYDNLVTEAAQSSSMKGNPVPLTARDLHAVLERAA